MRAVSLILLAGCGPPEAPVATDTGSVATGSVITPTSPGSADSTPPREPEVGVGCRREAHPLLVRCWAELDKADAVTLELTATGAPPRSFTSEAGTAHELLGWGLRPETTYAWSLAGHSGTVRTGALPKALQTATVEVEGEAFGFDAVLYPMACPGQGYFTMIDGEGHLVWYAVDDVFTRGSMTGYEWSASSRTVLAVNREQLLEQDLAGNPVLSLIRGEDYEHFLHHDVARWGRYRYLLFERAVKGVMVDGIHVFDGSTRIATWGLEDAFTVDPSQTTPGGDWSHANGINVTDSGEIILSILRFSNVLSLDGDPASDSFLDLQWVAAGRPDASLPGADYVPPSSPGEGFLAQHNASRVGDELWVFDNASQQVSRALRMTLDHVDGKLPITGEWAFDRTCRNQGGALPIEGGVLATCANAGRVWAFADDAVAPAWTLWAQCDARVGRLPLTRGIPITIE